MTTKLCVGLNKVALLRSSRGNATPSLVEVASALVEGGCEALLVHQWPDNRHVRPDDVRALAEIPAVAAGRVTLSVGSDLRPETLELVRGTPGVRVLVVTPFEAAHLTTQRGWRPTDDQASLVGAVRAIAPGAHVSVFVDPEEASVRAAAAAGASSVELNCRAYVERFGTPAVRDALARLAEAGDLARSLGLRVHAAHDLGARHLPELVDALHPEQVSVGHNFVAAALLEGMCRVLPTFLRAVG